MTDETNTNADDIIKAWEAASWCDEKPTASLRFISRDGKAILQQRWVVRTWTAATEQETHEWRDVQRVEAE